MMGEVELVALAQDAGMRLDRFVSGAAGISRAAAQQLMVQGHVLVNGELMPKSYMLQEGDRLKIYIPPPREAAAAPQAIPLEIVYEDSHLLVVNKAKGMVVHPAAGNLDNTLVNALLHHCGESLSGIGGEIRPGIVHRIDKDTSGLLVVAKDDNTHEGLSRQFAAHSITRVYHAVAHGGFKEDEGEVDAPIGRSTTDRKKMTVTHKNAKQAVTNYRVLRRYDGFTYIALRLKTGRTHQIRVHMASIGHPLAGDAVYGPRRAAPGLKGQCLHAKVLGFVHPASGEYMEFDSELPAYFAAFLRRFEEKV